VRRPLALVLLAVLAGCGGGGGADTVTLGDTDVVQPTRPEAAPEASHGSGPRGLFAEQCGSCHTLRAAGVNGLVGPNLDEVRPSEARVRRFIRNGSSDGVMPADLLEGTDARRVAAYVARVAGGR